jgi:hypothetical protein
VLQKITNRSKVSHIVYLACSAQAGVVAKQGVSQLAPAAVITMVGTNKKLQVDGHAELTVNQVIALDASNEGWTFTAAG